MSDLPVTLRHDTRCRVCDQQMLTGAWAVLDEYGYRHPADCGGDL